MFKIHHVSQLFDFHNTFIHDLNDLKKSQQEKLTENILDLKGEFCAKPSFYLSSLV